MGPGCSHHYDPLVKIRKTNCRSTVLFFKRGLQYYCNIYKVADLMGPGCSRHYEPFVKQKISANHIVGFKRGTQY